MFRMFNILLSSLLVVGLFFSSGCDEQLADYDVHPDVVSMERSADTTMDLTLGDCEAEADATDAEAAADDAPCVWVWATVNIGGVIVSDWVWVCGNTITVWVPNDPALIGLPITVTLPNGAKACGTVTL